MLSTASKLSMSRACTSAAAWRRATCTSSDALTGGRSDSINRHSGARWTGVARPPAPVRVEQIRRLAQRPRLPPGVVVAEPEIRVRTSRAARFRPTAPRLRSAAINVISGRSRRTRAAVSSCDALSTAITADRSGSAASRSSVRAGSSRRLWVITTTVPRDRRWRCQAATPKLPPSVEYPRRPLHARRQSAAPRQQRGQLRRGRQRCLARDRFARRGPQPPRA